VSLRDARTNCGRLFQTDAAASGKARQARSLMVAGGAWSDERWRAFVGRPNPSRVSIPLQWHKCVTQATT